MATSTALCNHEIRLLPQSSDAKQRYIEISEALKQFERHVAEWPIIAKLCLEVQSRELWRHGPYHSWTDWLNSLAPNAATTIFARIRVFEKLNGDFTTEELCRMPMETAKVITQLSKSVRKNPEIRRLSNQKKNQFVRVLKQVAPEQHIEEDFKIVFKLSASQLSLMEETFEEIRKQDPSYSDAAILEILCANWWAIPE